MKEKVLAICGWEDKRVGPKVPKNIIQSNLMGYTVIVGCTVIVEIRFTCVEISGPPAPL